MHQQAEGCSGAEVVLICQEAALLTMKDDISAPFVSPPRMFAAKLVDERVERCRTMHSSLQPKE